MDEEQELGSRLLQLHWVSCANHLGTSKLFTHIRGAESRKPKQAKPSLIGQAQHSPVKRDPGVLRWWLGLFHRGARNAGNRRRCGKCKDFCGVLVVMALRSN